MPRAACLPPLGVRAGERAAALAAGAGEDEGEGEGTAGEGEEGEDATKTLCTTALPNRLDTRYWGLGMCWWCC